MNHLWKYEGEDYIGKVITIEDWENLGEQVRSTLLDDLVGQKNEIARMQNQMSIQSNDYDMPSIMYYSKRKDVRYAIIRMIFKGEKRIDDELITQFINEASFLDFYIKILKASGVPFKDDTNEEDDDINPTPKDASAEET